MLNGVILYVAVTGLQASSTTTFGFNRHTTPRFYPNAVTLSSSQSTRQYEIIRALIKMGIPGDWAVKDSFDTLDLASGGFHEVIRGEWIHRPTSEIPEIRIPGVSWKKI